MGVEKVISGGQTGADQGALRAARAAGIATGGWAPAGWETEAGPAPWLAGFGLVECPEPGYAARRRRNVQDADAVLLFGDASSPGSRGLIRDCRERAKGWVNVEPGVETPRMIVEWIRESPYVKTLMVAGNRESKSAIP
jgi:hypothetical protein